MNFLWFSVRSSDYQVKREDPALRPHLDITRWLWDITWWFYKNEFSLEKKESFSCTANLHPGILLNNLLPWVKASSWKGNFNSALGRETVLAEEGAYFSFMPWTWIIEKIFKIRLIWEASVCKFYNSSSGLTIGGAQLCPKCALLSFKLSDNLLTLAKAVSKRLSTSSGWWLDWEDFGTLADTWDLNLHHTTGLCPLHTSRLFSLSLGVTTAGNINPQAGTGRGKFPLSLQESNLFAFCI